MIDDLRDAYRSLLRAKSAMHLLGVLYLTVGVLILITVLNQRPASIVAITFCIVALLLPSIVFFILPGLVRVYRWARFAGIVLCSLMAAGWLALLSLFIVRVIGIHDFFDFKHIEVTTIAIILTALGVYHAWLVVLLARCLQFDGVIGARGFDLIPEAQRAPLPVISQDVERGPR